MAQIGRRVKTTHELLEELKQRDGGTVPAAPASDAEDFRRSKTEHLAKFLNSQAEAAAPSTATPAPPNAPGSPTTRTIAEILASLPPIDPSVLLHDSEDEERDVEPSPPTEELVERVLAGEGVEGVTGNMEEDGQKTEQAFREWHEPVWRRSYDGQPLYVWPYVITD
jgi:hypothetical protein